MQLFKSPKELLGDLDAVTAASVVAAAADIALITDKDGVILDVAIPRTELSAELADQKAWVGKSWADIVSEETRPKIALLLDEVTSHPWSRWRQMQSSP